MAKRRNNRYSGYHGRKSGGSAVLKVIIALLAAALLACVVFVVFLGGKVEYTDDGVRIVLPWSDNAADSGDPGVQTTPPLIVVDPAGDPSGSDSPEPSPEPEDVPERIAALEVTAAQILDGSALPLVQQAAANALVVEMKDEYGSLSWVSAAELTGTLDVNAENNALAEAIQELSRSEDVYLVARVVCFRDQALANAGIGGPLLSVRGKTWYDYYGVNWVSPVNGEVCTYLTQLCLELSAMGFDEILLDCAGYPDLGETYALGTNELRPEDRTESVEQFLSRIGQALKGSGTALSVVTTGAALAGTDEDSGLSAEVLAACAYRVWVVQTAAGTDYAALLSEAGMANAEAGLVLVGEESTGGSWARINAVKRIK